MSAVVTANARTGWFGSGVGIGLLIRLSSSYWNTWASRQAKEMNG
jgi:hypothetical protein